jgi:hypothetical protein
MNQKFVVIDTEIENELTIEDVNVSVWSELDQILGDRGISVRNKDVFQGNGKEPFKSPLDPVDRQPLVYIYLFPAQVESGNIKA